MRRLAGSRLEHELPTQLRRRHIAWACCRCSAAPVAVARGMQSCIPARHDARPYVSNGIKHLHNLHADKRTQASCANVLLDPSRCCQRDLCFNAEIADRSSGQQQAHVQAIARGSPTCLSLPGMTRAAYRIRSSSRSLSMRLLRCEASASCARSSAWVHSRSDLRRDTACGMGVHSSIGSIMLVHKGPASALELMSSPAARIRS